MKRDAIISDCGRFRYLLSRVWNDDLLPLLFVMLNPSTADALVDDATIRRCVNFARAEGRFGGIEVVNLFAYRATDLADLRRAGWPVGDENDAHIAAAAVRAGAVCVAWGAVKEADDRVQVVMPIIRGAGHAPQCLHVTRSGYPGHPLYLASAKRLTPLDAAIEAAMET
jgi:hypothetical protein